MRREFIWNKDVAHQTTDVKRQLHGCPAGNYIRHMWSSPAGNCFFRRFISGAVQSYARPALCDVHPRAHDGGPHRILPTQTLAIRARAKAKSRAAPRFSTCSIQSMA